MEIEFENERLMHSTLVNDLTAIAAKCNTLDEVQTAVDALALNPHWWQVYRGGHHIALLFREGFDRFHRAVVINEPGRRA